MFGCSMTRYCYATWADLIGCNFDEYYNYARSGSSNILSMNRFVEADSMFNFNNETDTVIIMITGLARFSYYQTEKSWMTHGDLYSYLDQNDNATVKFFVKNMFDINCAIYQSWAAIKLMKQLLLAKNIPHKFLLGVDVEFLKSIDDITTTKYIQEILDISENKTPLDIWSRKKGLELNISNTVYYHGEKRDDGHPNQRIHYEFVKTFLPEYDTEKTKNTFDYVESIWDGSTQHMQEYTYKTLFYKDYNKMFQHPLFGQEQGEV